MINITEFIKNNKNMQFFINDCEKNDVAHGYLVVADDKTTLTQSLDLMCCALLCETGNACGHCRNCSRIISGNHSNIFILNGNENSIKVEDIKKLIESTFVTALEKGRKVFVINGGDKMTEAAQNKLLKTLEEPSKDVALLIGTVNETNILPTVKSRCNKVYIKIWNEDSIRRALTQVSADNEAIDIASRYGDGSIERALNVLTDEKFLKKREEVIYVLSKLNSSGDIPVLTGILGKDKETFKESLAITELIISNILKNKSNDSTDEISKKYNVQTLAGIYELVIDAAKKLNYNCNIGNIENALLLGILETKYLLS